MLSCMGILFLRVLPRITIDIHFETNHFQSSIAAQVSPTDLLLIFQKSIAHDFCTASLIFPTCRRYKYFYYF